MKEGQTDFLDLMVDDPPEAASSTPAPEPTAPPEATDQQPRTPDGKFAEKPKAEAQQGDKPEAQPAPVAEPPSAEPQDVKGLLAALKAEREKRQTTEAELAKLRPTAAAAPQSQPPKPPEFTPPQVDFEQDPQTYVQAQIHSIKMQQSQFFAEQQSSKEAVAEAWHAFDAACAADPAVAAYSQALVNHPHPMGEVLKWHRQQQDLRMLTEAGGLEKLREKWLAEAQANQAPPAPVAQAPQQRQSPKPVTPPSLATGGAGIKDAPEMPTEDQVFDEVFGGPKTRKR